MQTHAKMKYSIRTLLLFLLGILALYRQGQLFHLVLKSLVVDEKLMMMDQASQDSPPISSQQQQQYGVRHSLTNLVGIQDKTYHIDDINDDVNCPFRNSSLYRSIYVYPSPGEEDWKGDMLSKYAPTVTSWPWIDIDQQSRNDGTVHYDPSSQAVQYTTELLVRDIITHPDSCLRTYDPEEASLFYVPYLPSVEYHNGTLSLGDYKTSPFGQALLDATEGKYDTWESTFGLTYKFWQRKNGSDHILVVSEPLHGLWHPKSRRGSFHFIHSQKQLAPPIVISVELSRTFVEKYPNCARKNILMPYPNTDGRWFNGKYSQEAQENYQQNQITVSQSKAVLPAEQKLIFQLSAHVSNDTRIQPRPLAQFYKAGNHGTCSILRKAMEINFQCTPSAKVLRQRKNSKSLLQPYMLAYHQSTFCPCPGGDSPSAKRMFDALQAGCIPLILSEDYVWPFTPEFDIVGTDNNDGTTTTQTSQSLHPNDFSIRLQSSDYYEAAYNASCRTRKHDTMTTADSPSNTIPTSTIQDVLEGVEASTIQRLRQGTVRAADQYAYYARRADLPDNPLRENVLPDGGAAHTLIKALEERAHGQLWPACKDELDRGSAKPKEHDAMKFKC